MYYVSGMYIWSMLNLHHVVVGVLGDVLGVLGDVLGVLSDVVYISLHRRVLRTNSTHVQAT